MDSYWLESLEAEAAPTADEARRQLEVEVASLHRELAELRADLAAKTVQLSKRDQTERAAQEKWAEQRAAELLSAAVAPKDDRISALEQMMSQLEVALSQKTEELEESRRLFSSQKRALKDALSAAADREAADVAAGESGLEAATAAAEEEVERLAQELAQVKTRSALELQAKEAELAELQQQLAVHEAHKQAAVAAAEAAAAASAQAELSAAVSAHQAREAELQSELQRWQHSCLHDQREDMADQFAAVSKDKQQLQREFDAFKDLTAQASRQHREEQVRLLEENASLKSRIAAEAARVAMGVLPGRAAAGVARPPASKTFAAVADGDGMGGAVEAWLVKLERQRRGLVPLLVVSSLVLLVLLIAIMRAAASAREDESGFVCFLSKLGVQIGAGCHGSPNTQAQAVKQALGELVEATPRVKAVSIAPGVPTTGSILQADGSVVSVAGLRRRLL